MYNQIKHTLLDLGETYKRSSPTQIKALIGSIFPNGLSWDYSGTLNYEVSPFFQSILRFNGQGVPLGVPDASLYEPIAAILTIYDYSMILTNSFVLSLHSTSQYIRNSNIQLR